MPNNQSRHIGLFRHPPEGTGAGQAASRQRPPGKTKKARPRRPVFPGNSGAAPLSDPMVFFVPRPEQPSGLIQLQRACIQLIVGALELDQVFVGAALDDAAVIQKDVYKRQL